MHQSPLDGTGVSAHPVRRSKPSIPGRAVGSIVNGRVLRKAGRFGLDDLASTDSAA